MCVSVCGMSVSGGGGWEDDTRVFSLPTLSASLPSVFSFLSPHIRILSSEWGQRLCGPIQMCVETIVFSVALVRSSGRDIASRLERLQPSLTLLDHEEGTCVLLYIGLNSYGW